VTSILIVDDDAGFRRAARALLERAGLVVVAEAGDAAAARAAYREHRPDGVLVDVNLPDVSGHALAGELLAAAPEARIVLTSTDERAGGPQWGPPFVPKLELGERDLASYFT